MDIDSRKRNIERPLSIFGTITLKFLNWFGITRTNFHANQRCKLH